ncbi:MAG TPA: hypothetical protein DGV23_11430 [Stenotrophomonas sp.]|nr:hypothetical protein [Stenotrophomonas sp.]
MAASVHPVADASARRDRRQRLVYAALAVLLGGPSVLLGGALAAMGMVGAVLSLADGTVALPGQALMLVWGAAGLAGCIAWLGLSCGYLLEGRSALRTRSRAQWAALLLGMLASLPLLGIGLWLGFTHGSEAFGLLLAGPSLLVPAGMLCAVRPRA